MKRFTRALCAFALLALLGGTAHAAKDSVTQKPWGKTTDGKVVSLYTLTNAQGAEARITNYGGILVSLKVPDRRGRMGDIVLGYDTVGGYIKSSPYFGALIGRYGNRIAKGKFTLDGKKYTLATNNAPNHLHGGKVGFDKRVWTATPHSGASPSLSLSLVSPDGQEGYPGTLTAHVTYTLTDDNALMITYAATTDKETVLNLTHHSYFNLNGAGNGDILSHRLMINADRFTPIDKTSIPLGPLRNVAGTPFDFRTPHAIGSRINQHETQLLNGKGYDHNFVLNGRIGTLRPAAQAYSPKSGRVMTVFTTEPGVQLYTGNFLDGKNIGKGGKVYKQHYAFCLETQHFPDSPNERSYPTTVLKPGQTYRQKTVYVFTTH